MSIYLEWDNIEKTLIRCTFIGQWTWDELYNTLDVMRTNIDTVGHPVTAIFDMLNCQMPQKAVLHFERLSGLRVPNNSYGFLVTTHISIITVFNIFKRIYPEAAENYFVCKTLEEAYTLNKNLRN